MIINNSQLGKEYIQSKKFDLIRKNYNCITK